MSSVESLAQQLATAGADRDSLLLAFGGGVLGDITGFLAAIYMRGIRYVQIPTTFLAQVDSSIGGKTGVNLVAGKNLIGSFHHPQAVFADTDLLGTLPPAELRAGLQESIKAGIIYDAKLFRYMEQNADAILAGDPAALTRVVAASVRVKADVVSKDEKESGLRMILNFGHTIGHAIEAATNYKQLLHGEAVAWGSIAALNVAAARKTITQKDADRITQLILRYGPLPPFKATAEKLVALTSRDKKNRSGIRAFVLPTGIGKTEIVRDVTERELLAATESMLTLMRAIAQEVLHDQAQVIHIGSHHQPDVRVSRSRSEQADPPDLRCGDHSALQTSRPQRRYQSAARWQWIYGPEHPRKAHDQPHVQGAHAPDHRRT